MVVFNRGPPGFQLLVFFIRFFSSMAGSRLGLIGGPGPAKSGIHRRGAEEDEKNNFVKRGETWKS
jgi:hypothetical protein